MTPTITITFEEWVEQFKPLKNRIWTFAEDDGTIYVGEGMHIVNRMGYAVTEKPYAKNTFYCIEDDG